MAKNGTIEDAAHEERRRSHKAVNCSLRKVFVGVIAICFVINVLETFSFLETSAIKGDCILKSTATEESNGFDIVEATNSGTTRKHNNKPIAIVHVGPYKTGTTSIQSSLRENINFFQSENIYLPGIDSNKPGLIYDWSNCLTQKTTGSIGWCNPDALQKEKTSIRMTQYFGNNIILSSEQLSAPNIDLEQIEQLLTGYEIHIIVTYRRFFSQAVSAHGQALKQNDHNEGITWKAADVLEKKGLLSLSQSLHNRMKWNRDTHATSVVDRYKKRFDNISVINMNENPNMIEAFYCNDRVTTVTDACSKYRDGGLNEAVDTNKAVIRDYDVIAIAARRLGLLNGEQISRLEATMAIQNHYEDVRGLDRKSLPTICVDDDLVAQLEKISIDYEYELLPYLNQSSKSIGSSSIHQDIEKAKKAKLCSVDTLKVLKESDWINFFANLTRTSS